MLAILLALSAAASAADLPPTKPKQLWQASKSAVELGISTLRKKAPKGTKVDWWAAAKQPWDFALRVERIQDGACEAAVQRASSDEKLESERDRRATAARTLRDFRKLATYGWFVPSKMRELAEGDPAASVVAELFPLVMSEDEMAKRDRALVADTGLGAEGYATLVRAEEAKLSK